MIEIEAEILRGNSTPVYFVGETIECEIKFKCIDVKGNATGSKSSVATLTANKRVASDFSAATKPIDEKKVSEISESMFAVLASYPSQTSLSTNSSIATTPSSEKSFPFVKTNSKSITGLLLNEDKLTLSNFECDYDPDYVIAWACVQIDCNCHIDESKVILPKNPLRYNIFTDNKASDASTTSFQPNKDRPGISVYSSKPKILFCNLFLRPNESKSCNFNNVFQF
jgi:hypothetical protein